MAAANPKPRTLVLGHSFVRRLEDFAAQKHSDGSFDLNLGLAKVFSVIFSRERRANSGQNNQV